MTSNSSTTPGRFGRHPTLAKLVLVAISSMLTLLLGEGALRLLGMESGYVPRYKRFKPVEQLEVYKTYYTDVEGVFKANPKFDWTDPIRINSQGFRSPEFEPDPMSVDPKILFLGDSFTWGSSARPITDSFVDIVSHNGFTTFNTGIPGTDPTQYAYLAEKYVPLLKPDFVAVMFYMGNDLRQQPRPMLPYKNLFHDTNAKMLYAFDKHGNYMAPQEAYEYYLGQSNLASTDKSAKGTLRNVFMRSVLGTYTWVALSRLKRHQTSAASQEEDLRLKYDFTRQALQRIKDVSAKHGANFMLFLLPVHPGKVSIHTSIEHNLPLFEDLLPYIPDFLDEQDYMTLPNAHFNNSGHRKYAQFILEAIKEIQEYEGTALNVERDDGLFLPGAPPRPVEHPENLMVQANNLGETL